MLMQKMFLNRKTYVHLQNNFELFYMQDMKRQNKKSNEISMPATNRISTENVIALL